MLAPALALLLMQSSDELHPAFRLGTREEAMKAYAEGRKNAKRKLDDYVRPWCKDLGKVNSPSGYSFRTSFALLRTPSVFYRIAGYEDQRSKSSPAAFESKINESFAGVSSERRLNLTACLFAWPGVGWNNRLTYDAKESDVKSVEFLLLVDGNPNQVIHPDEGSILAKSKQHEGGVSEVRNHTEVVNASTIGTSTTVSSNGGIASSVNLTRTSGFVTYNSHVIRGFKAYEAVWDLTFPLFGKDGKPLIPASAKSLVLKVRRPDGELSTTFSLDEFR